MMLELTPRQKMNLYLERFQKLLKDIDSTFFWALEKKAGVNSTIKTKLVFTTNKNEAQRELLKELSELRQTILQEAKVIPDEDITKIDIDEVLDKYIPTYIGIPVISKNCEIFMWDARISMNNKTVTARYALDVLMPKILLIQHVDNLLDPIQEKLKDLENKMNIENNSNGKYAKAYCVADEIVRAALEARKLLVDSDKLQDTLQEIQNSLAAVYTDNNLAILGEHRGDPIINAMLNMINQFVGYIMYALTYPYRYFDDARTQTYVNSWFKPRQTKSLQIFRLFKQKIVDPLLAAEAGIVLVK